MIFNLQVELRDSTNYLESSARLRGISRKELLERVLRMVLNDQMILSVLDDDGTLVEQPGPAKGRHMPPRDQTNRPATPVLHRPPKFVRPSSMTKSQLRDQLSQAVVNTGGRSVRMSLEERKAELLRMAGVRSFCPSDLGGTDDQTKWQAALRILVDERRLVKRPPEVRTRKVYYELSPRAMSSSSDMTEGVAD